ncbi:MAG TPA: pyridoxal phosphate-dependent aminotransferase [Thermoleophilaceae bacterium]|nr:pyridoxal phosphate-dependent aminotransferase [Thermoleophilaceae bacterium]
MAEPAAVEQTPPPMAELRLAARAAWPEELIDLSRSEPLPIPMPPACATRVQEEFMRSRMYAPPAGLSLTRDAVARYMSAATGHEIGADRVAITAGAMHGISISLRALVEPGSEVLVPRPYFHAHPKQVAMLGSEPRFVDVRAQRGVVTAEAIERELSPRTRALLLCNPANPAGVVLGRQALEQILAVLPPSVAVISDEVYAEYLYEGSFTSMLGLVAEEDAGREVVVVNTASKTAAMPGWRVGSAVGSPGLAPRLGRASATMSGAPSTPAQLAYAAWLDEPPEVERMAPYRPRLREVLEAVEDAGLSVRPPDGTYYVWAGAEAEIGAPERVLEAARATGALVWPGVLFGDLQSVRISLSVPRRELREGVNRLADSWREVQPNDVPISRSRS